MWISILSWFWCQQEEILVSVSEILQYILHYLLFMICSSFWSSLVSFSSFCSSSSFSSSVFYFLVFSSSVYSSFLLHYFLLHSFFFILSSLNFFFELLTDHRQIIHLLSTYIHDFIIIHLWSMEGCTFNHCLDRNLIPPILVLCTTSSLFSMGFNSITIFQVQIVWSVVWRHSSSINQES